MSTLEQGLYELGRLDQAACADTPVHRLDPRAKVITTLVFIVCIVSFGKYDVLPMLPFMVFPIALASEGGLSFGLIGKRLLIAAPFAVFVGIFNPLLDREIVAHIGSIAISGGWVSYASILARFVLTVSAALVLIGTTRFNDVVLALQRIGMPEVLATQLLLLYRYIFVLAEEVMRMSRARTLRSFGDRGMGMRVYIQMLGQLLLRTFARAERIYAAMLGRGFTGQVRSGRRLVFTARDAVFILGWCGAFLAFRLLNIPLLLGSVVMRLGS
ncbi:MAG: cobalt ECF transporter T component CbiQ [Actinomycetota bacterium]|nr:MAG: cobalt/nickel transport system permease [Actinomycetota bacterium]MDO8950426.1 cobalt ECF transporter T component CbiQ [Actinomycetota bacterium]MDP3630175.1 cobalt ECF transporter T component CbiQ [Actinomycetota bacterium]